MNLSEIEPFLPCTFCSDSREVMPGAVFFALKGERVDGHDYLSDVAKRDAAACVVSDEWQGELEGPTVFRVRDVLQTLQDLARNWFHKQAIPTLAITGSVGKTTMRTFLQTVLEKERVVSASRKNYNSQVGLPLTILNDLKGNEDLLILEMAMTHPGQIADLVQIAPPTFAAINKIAYVHSCNFSSLEGIAHAKAEIFSHPKTEWGLVPHGFPARPTHLPTETFSEGEGGDYSFSYEGEDLFLQTPEKERIRFSGFPFPGKHLRETFVVVAILAHKVGLSWEQIQERVPHLEMPPNRFRFVDKAGIRFLDDSYNASEPSVCAALETVSQLPTKGKRVAVLGSMMELGAFSEDCHRKVGKTALNCVDRIYCFGKECEPIQEVWKKEGREAPLYLSQDELLRRLKDDIHAGDLVLVKGSNSKNMHQLIEQWETNERP